MLMCSYMQNDIFKTNSIHRPSHTLDFRVAMAPQKCANCSMQTWCGDESLLDSNLPQHAAYKYCCMRCESLHERSKNPSLKPQRNQKHHGPKCLQIPFVDGVGIPCTVVNEIEQNSPPIQHENAFGSSSSSSSALPLVAAPVVNALITVPRTRSRSMRRPRPRPVRSRAMPLEIATPGYESFIIQNTPIGVVRPTCPPTPIDPVHRSNDAQNAAVAALPDIQRSNSDGDISDLDRLLCLQAKALPFAPPENLVRANEADAIDHAEVEAND
jgi:hypothetical protein